MARIGYSRTMRLLVALGLVCGCSSGPSLKPDPTADAAMAVDGPDTPASLFRSATAIVTNGDTVAWSLGSVECPLEGLNCEVTDTTLLRASLASGLPHGLVATREGITIVGDMNEFFYVDSDSSSLKYVVRFRPNDPSPQPTGMSVPQAQVFNLSVDTEYVYWFERANGDAGRMRRASRLGDGTDAVTISGVDGGILFAGYFWSNSCVISSCTVSRVPVTGGATEVVATNTGSIIGVDASNLYLVQVDASSPNERILAMHADGTLETVTDYNPLGPNVNFVSTGDELFWTTSIGDLRKVPRAGGVPVVVAGVATFAPFAVTSDTILFEFSVNGYKSVPR